MPRYSASVHTIPPEAVAALTQLGEHIRLSRRRRKASQTEWAARLGVTVPTLTRLERGDPRVSMGVYVTALWLMGRSHALKDLAAPEHDLGALERDIQIALRPRSTSKHMPHAEARDIQHEH